MAAPSMLPAPARGYIRAYLLTWGVLASAGLGYLASLAWQPDLFKATPAVPPAELEEGLQLANRAWAEVGSARREIGEVRRDLGELRAVVAEHDEQNKRIESRVVALTERIATPPVAPATPPAADAVAEKPKADKPRKTVAARPPQRGTSESPPAPAHQDAAPLATGSIASPPIAFGAPVVTPSPALPFAVQLAASHSLEAIRQSWSQLRERHAASLAALEPHVVPPRADGSGHFRLVAGPLPTRAEAERLCAELAVGHQGCFATTFSGQPL
jgi:hypothetical protein